MTFIAVRCPHCHSEQIVKRGKTARVPSAPCARMLSVRRGAFGSTIVTAAVYLR